MHERIRSGWLETTWVSQWRRSSAVREVSMNDDPGSSSQEGRQQMFLRNCWYMTGWSTDFSADAIVGCTLLGEAIVVYRKADGVLAALEDRCCHRLAPLSVGGREGGDITCIYHGV